MEQGARRGLPVEYDQIITQTACYAIASEYQPEDLEDLCQEARLKVLLKADEIERADNPLAYCRRIAHNAIVDSLRREARHQHEPLPE